MNDDYGNDNVDTNNDVDKFTQNTISFNHTASSLKKTDWRIVIIVVQCGHKIIYHRLQRASEWVSEPETENETNLNIWEYLFEVITNILLKF